MSKRSLVAATLAMTLCGAFPPVLVAQAPLPGMPMVDPPVSHPGLAAQPLFGGSRPAVAASDPSPAVKPPAGKPMPPAAPDTSGPQRSGKDLKKAVAAVQKLHWFDKLGDARAKSTATGKPILFIQALGDLEGFA
jgi:hypothetical protein